MDRRSLPRLNIRRPVLGKYKGKLGEKQNFQNALPYGSEISGTDPEQVILTVYPSDPDIRLKLQWDPDTDVFF